ncbi:MAG: hypothetical protein WCP22_13270 [Chlamydiota bacterium]
MRLPISVLQIVQRDFAEKDQQEVETILSSYGQEASEKGRERILRDILLLAKGDKKQVQELIDRAKRDYRDIIFWAEYPSESKLDTPSKIEQFNKMLKQLGANWQVPSKEEDA